MFKTGTVKNGTPSNAELPILSLIRKLQDVKNSQTNPTENSSTDEDNRSSKRIDYSESDRAIIAGALESVAETAELHGCCDLNAIAI